MPQINCIILFDGTTDDNQQKNVTNIVKLYNGLIRDEKQIVLYEAGIGNDLEWKWYLSRLFADITGYGAGWVMNRAYQRLITKLKAAMEKGDLNADDTLCFSVGGFSRGAALARQFVHSFLDKKLKKIFPKLHIKIEAEYLFDTVPAFGLPLHLKIAKWVGIKLENQGWNFSIPKDVTAYHALSIDEKRWAFKPCLVNYHRDKAQEVWFAGDHASVGGGNALPYPDAVMADQLPLQYIANCAIKHGLRFTHHFHQTHLVQNPKAKDGCIDTPSWSELPASQLCNREIYTQVWGKRSSITPIIDKSVIYRIKHHNYHPAFLHHLKLFRVQNKKGETKLFDEIKIEKLLESSSLTTSSELEDSPVNPYVIRKS